MSHFFAYMSRMKLILRWGLMRNTHQENDQEHSLQVAMIAHALAVIDRVRYGGDVDANHVLSLAVYHDASEVITGDLATPIKYFNPEIRQAFSSVEKVAAEKLVAMLPEDLQASYQPLLLPDEDTPAWRIVKAADRISAYLKCVEEEKAGNKEFEKAKISILASIQELGMPAVADFMREFVPSFELTVDELN